MKDRSLLDEIPQEILDPGWSGISIGPLKRRGGDSSIPPEGSLISLGPYRVRIWPPGDLLSVRGDLDGFRRLEVMMSGPTQPPKYVGETIVQDGKLYQAIPRASGDLIWTLRGSAGSAGGVVAGAPAAPAGPAVTATPSPPEPATDAHRPHDQIVINDPNAKGYVPARDRKRWRRGR